MMRKHDCSPIALLELQKQLLTLQFMYIWSRKNYEYLFSCLLPFSGQNVLIMLFGMHRMFSCEERNDSLNIHASSRLLMHQVSSSCETIELIDENFCLGFLVTVHFSTSKPITLVNIFLVNPQLLFVLLL